MSTIVETSKKKATKTVKVSEYKKQVINTNQKLKLAHKTLGGCLKNMHLFADEMGLTEAQRDVIKLLRDKKEVQAYNEFKKACRVTKNGYSPFFVLQAMYKASKLENKPTKEKNLTPIKQKTVKELKEIAKGKNIKGYSKMTKAQLIVAVVAR